MFTCYYSAKFQPLRCSDTSHTCVKILYDLVCLYTIMAIFFSFLFAAKLARTIALTPTDGGVRVNPFGGMARRPSGTIDSHHSLGGEVAVSASIFVYLMA